MDELEIIKDKLHDEIDHIGGNLAYGSAKSYDEYQKFCGMVKGLATAINHIEGLQEAKEKGEYEDDN
jgi:hypothetical protein|tara:strand:+ start:2204 stop:2404 length:201 start_codon:yes stop_codon:yes gene_type:complete